MSRTRWTDKEKEFVYSHLNKLAPSQIAQELGKSERAVCLFLHRHRLNTATVVKKNIILIILKMAFVDPEYFKPTRTFYDAVKLGQKRWWALYKGVRRPTDEECLRIATHLKVDMKELFENRQMNMFENE
jgi:hypothetical protein